ncbi:MAG: DNA-processing protein DprA [Lachnospiraceae bacterium]|nr:DNA-processing protein DprA [Lachnospiraceae bacterium]
MNSENYEYWLLCIPHLPSRIKILLDEHCGSAENVYRMSSEELGHFQFMTDDCLQAVEQSRRVWNADDAAAELERSGARIVTWRSADYPFRMSTLSDAPYAFCLKGRMPDPGMPMVAIVGARACSPYGKRQAEKITEALASSGVGIISGMALGIDGIAQRCALEQGGYSLAVLGCGVDICYPERHHPLYNSLINKGGIISEFPALEPPLKTHFPQRNRLISVLADAVVVIEAREKSGSLITADFALEQGRDVYALPGPCDSLLSRGCHKLIEQGARILIDPADILKELGKAGTKKKSAPDPGTLPPLPDQERIIMEHLSDAPVKLSELELMTGFTPQILSGSLLSLQLKGLARELSRQHYIRA